MTSLFYMECYIKSEYNNKYLDVENSSIKCGAKVIVSSYHGGPSQKWRIQGDKIFSVNSKHALDIRFGEKKGRQIIQWDSNNGSNQKWYLYEDGTIRSPEGFCLDAYDGKYVVSADNDEYPWQKWQIIKCEDFQIININVIQVSLKSTNIQNSIAYNS